ncbi:uncharacterized protein PV07_11487 [Cladophialophora immunda]|uniref:Extracellular membrane protein CFEM domain-containing protein n=1 Tax=Cladophialophora immunda TaxID=569365 RepID=A0A0D1Z6L2_9EURO|nr:uncharacterized protein PV07_11487 [Cladophialophora immunda]KIW23276.1 hypothetical protein PV07_11487 [Cladophialophora immunda]OQV09067.1 hypothetical protein CLAIMM_13245 [Cladophialophora immunda]
MDLSLLSLAWWCSLLFQPGAAQTSNPKPQEIYTLTAFQEQQICVQSCFTYGYGCTTDLVGQAIGCSIDACDFTSTGFGALDSCYCRGDLQLAAESFLTSCIQESCTVGDTSVNVAAAVSIYGGYCTSLGYTALPANNVAETTAPNSNPTTNNNNNGAASSTGSTTDIFATSPTSDGSGGSSSSSSGGTSSSSSSSNTTTYIVLGVVGSVALILLALAALWFKKYRELKRTQPQFRYGAGAGAPMHYGYNGGGGSGGMGQPLRPLGSEVSSHPFYRQDDIYPDDSVSTIHVAPAYPHPLEPSLVSTQMR